MGFLDIFGGKKSSAPAEKYVPPPYVPSEYDAPAAKDIFSFYDPRTRGENTGYAPEDIKTMEGQAQDYSTRQTNEAIRRGAMARRRGTGGTYSGGRDVMRDEAIRGGLEYRSNAMRDIAVRNAVQKHSDQWNAVSGMGTFLNNERAHALSKWSGASQGAQQAYQFNQVIPSIIDNQNNMFSSAAGFQNTADIAKLAVNLFTRFNQPTVNAGY